MASHNYPQIPDLGSEPFYEDEMAEMLMPESNPTHQESIPVDNQSVHQEEDPADVEGSTRGKRPRTSAVWDHFTVEKLPNPKTGGVEDRSVCKYCKKSFSHKKGGGTGHLQRHWPACQQLHQGSGVSSSQQTLSLTPTRGLQNFNYDAQRARESLAKFLASAELPLSFADDETFEEFVQTAFCPQFKRFESVKGDAPTSTKCYMHETGASEDEAHQHMKFLTNEAWKQTNEDQAAKSPFSQKFIESIINGNRMTMWFYDGRDGYGVQYECETKDCASSFFFEPIPSES